MGKLSKPDDGKQGSLRDKFPALSSLAAAVDSSSNGKTTASRPDITHSKSLFDLAQSFFKLKIDDSPETYATATTGGHTERGGHVSPIIPHSTKDMQRHDPLYYPRPPTLSRTKVHNTWNPLASIRGKLRNGYCSVRDRYGSVHAPSAAPEFDAGIEPPMRRRKSLHGLHDAWGTVGKRFTLRGRRRTQAASDLEAHLRQLREDIELPDRSPPAFDIHEDAEALSSSGLSSPSTGVRELSNPNSVDKKSIALLDREVPECGKQMSEIAVTESIDSKKRYSGMDRSAGNSCPSKAPIPIRSRPSQKHVAFASATQLKLREQANNGSLHRLAAPPSPRPLNDDIWLASTRRLAHEEAQFNLLEDILSDSASFTSVDLDTFHEKKRNLRQARYNLLMDPVQQVKNFETFTQVIENTSRMLANIGHADAEVIPAGMSFVGPVYTWSPKSVIQEATGIESPEVFVDAVSVQKDGKICHFEPAADPKIEHVNNYAGSIITTTELLEVTEPSETGIGNWKVERGRLPGRTPTRKLASNNRSPGKSPPKRYNVKLTPNNPYARMVNNGSPSSTVAVRCPSVTSEYSISSPDLVDDSEAEWTSLELDTSYLAIGNHEPSNSYDDEMPPSALAALRAFQAEEEAKFKGRQNEGSKSSGVSAELQLAFRDLMTPPLEDMVAMSRPSSTKVQTDEELEQELAAFQAAEQAKFKTSTVRGLECNKLLSWPLGKNVGRRFALRGGERFSGNAQEVIQHSLTYEGAEVDMEWKKEHWVEGFALAKRRGEATIKERGCSFSFMAKGKKVRMEAAPDSSFFSKTSSTIVYSHPHAQKPSTKAQRAVFDDEDDFVLDSSLSADSDVDNDADNDADFSYGQKSISDLQDAKNICGTWTNTSLSDAFNTATGIAAATQPSFNKYGNIVRCWSPPPHADPKEHKREDTTARNIPTTKWVDTTYWPIDEQNICRKKYPVDPPRPRSPEQTTTRNVDSGYWDAEKSDAAADADIADVAAAAPDLGSASPEEAAGNSILFGKGKARETGSPSKAEVAATPPHTTAAHILARFEPESKEISPKECNDFVEAYHVALSKSLSNSAKRDKTQKIASTVPLPASPLPISEGTQTSPLKPFLLDKNRGKVDAEGKGKGKGKERQSSGTWKGKAQEWPTFIALEPAHTTPASQTATTGNGKERKDKKKAPPLPPRNSGRVLGRAEGNEKRRDTTPQASITGNGIGPVSPLTKAWLESKRGKALQNVLWGTSNGSGLTSSSGNVGKATTGVAPIRGLKGQGERNGGEKDGEGRVAMGIRTFSGLSLTSTAETVVDEGFGVELKSFRGVSGESGERGENEEKGEENEEGKSRRVPSWMLYG